MLRLSGPFRAYPSLEVTPVAGGTPIAIRRRLTSYGHTIADGVGFESLQATFSCTPDEAVAWLGRLRSAIVASDADGLVCWEGYISQVDIVVGGRARSISLGPMANRVRCRYTLRGLGVPRVTSAVSSSASIAAFGTKDAVISLGETDSTAAAATAAAYLATYAYPRAQPSVALAAGSPQDTGGATVSLTGAGWYTTLDWVLTERSDTSTESTTTQVGALIGASSPGIGATNPNLISTTTAQIASSGVSDSREIPADTPYRAKIEQLLGAGTSGGQRLSWGVYEGRVLHVTAWRTTTYTVRQASAVVTTNGARLIPPWQVRPGATVIDADVAGLAQPATPIDTGAQFVLARVDLRAGPDGWGLTLEPAAINDVDARIARLT